MGSNWWSRLAYTLARHTDAESEFESEADRLMVKHFITTLAEIALSVASRTAGK